MARFGDDHWFKESVAWVVGVFTLALVAQWLGGAQVALLVIVLPIAYHYLFRAPVHESVKVLFLLALFVEPPDLFPGAGYWESPLDTANRMLYGFLQKTWGIPGASFPFLFVIVGILTYRARKVDPPENATPSVRVARTWLTRVLYTFFALEAWGIARQGAIQPSYFQSLQLVFRIFFTRLLLRALRKEDVPALGTILVVVAIFRGFIAAWVYLLVCRPMGIVPEYATHHADSILFAGAFLVLVAAYLEDRSKSSLVRLGLWGTWLMAAMVFNNRRLAFVCVGLGAIGMYAALPPSKLRRKVNKFLWVLGPTLAAYVLIGGEKGDNPLFAPARLFYSALNQKDASSDSRDIENNNLLATLNENPVLGSGFGHEYKEVYKVYEIAEFFPLYKYIPHNSVLWLWTVGGLLGFFLMWSLYPLAAYLAARAYRMSYLKEDRIAALAAFGVVGVIIAMDWGDVGTNAWMGHIVYAGVLVAAAKISGAGELDGLVPIKRE